MYVTRTAELPPNVTASFGYNVDLGQVVLESELPRPLPCNVTLVPSPNVILVDQGGGVMRINLPDVYIYITGGMDLPSEWWISNDHSYCMSY